jgi:biopolymer transport protein ExbD
MSIKGGGFQKSSKPTDEVPTSSLADIAFLLLIFFMVTTVFQNDRDRPIEWPRALAAQKIDEKQKNILNIWMERDGVVYINDQAYSMEQVTTVVAPLYAHEGALEGRDGVHGPARVRPAAGPLSVPAAAAAAR